MDARVAALIGVPFIDNGRTLQGCDCYGLVRLALKRVYNKELPLLDSSYVDLRDAAFIVELISDSKALIDTSIVSVPTPGDVVIMRYLGREQHMGVYVGDGYILHTESAAIGSHLARINDINIASRIVEYRHVN